MNECVIPSSKVMSFYHLNFQGELCVASHFELL